MNGSGNVTNKGLLPKAWSKSSVSSLLDGCPWAWFLTKVEGLPDPGSPATIRGTAFHAAVEAHERARLGFLRDHEGALLSQDEMTEAGIEALRQEVPTLPAAAWDRHRTSPGKVEGEVAALVDNWWGAPLDEGHGSIRDWLLDLRPYAIEPYVVAPIGDHRRPVHGYIDAVYWDAAAEEWVVVDTKTANKLDRWHPSGAGHETEASFYLYAALEAGNVPVAAAPVRMEFHVVRPVAETGRTGQLSRIVTMRYTPEMAEQWAAARIDQAEAVVRSGNFPKNTEWNLCSAKWCAHYEGCEVTGELSPEVVLDGGRK